MARKNETSVAFKRREQASATIFKTRACVSEAAFAIFLTVHAIQRARVHQQKTHTASGRTIDETITMRLLLPNIRVFRIKIDL